MVSISRRLIELALSPTRPDEHAIAFKIADMATAAPPRAPYDRLVSRFGIMFFDDPPAAFANLLQWLAPGGRFAFAVWGSPAENPWKANVRQVVAEIIDLPKPDAQAPGPFRYAESDTLLTLLKRAGYDELAVKDWRGMLPIGGGMPAAEAANFALTSFSSFGELLAEAGARALNEAHQSLTVRFSEYEQRGVVQMEAFAHIFTRASWA